MFNKTRLERVFKFLVEDEQHLGRHDVEIMNLKGWVSSHEEEVSDILEALDEIKDRLAKLEQKHCCSECGK